jgi:hypothetical protein
LVLRDVFLILLWRGLSAQIVPSLLTLSDPDEEGNLAKQYMSDYDIVVSKTFPRKRDAR